MTSGVHSGHMDVTVSTKILIDPCHQWDLANRSINWMLPVEITNDAKPVPKKNMVNNVSLSWSHMPTSQSVVVMSHFDISKPLLISNLASIKFSNVTIVLLLTSSNITKSTQTSPLSILTLTGTDLLGAKDEKIQTVQNTIINAVILECLTNGTIQTLENVALERVSVNSTNHVKIFIIKQPAGLKNFILDILAKPQFMKFVLLEIWEEVFHFYLLSFAINTITY